MNCSPDTKAKTLQGEDTSIPSLPPPHPPGTGNCDRGRSQNNKVVAWRKYFAKGKGKIPPAARGDAKLFDARVALTAAVDMWAVGTGLLGVLRG